MLLSASAAASSSSAAPGPRAGPADPFDATLNSRVGHVIPPGVRSPEASAAAPGTVSAFFTAPRATVGASIARAATLTGLPDAEILLGITAHGSIVARDWYAPYSCPYAIPPDHFPPSDSEANRICYATQLLKHIRLWPRTYAAYHARRAFTGSCPPTIPDSADALADAFPAVVLLTALYGVESMLYAADVVIASATSDAHAGGSAGRWVVSCCDYSRVDAAAAWAIEGLLVGLCAGDPADGAALVAPIAPALLACLLSQHHFAWGPDADDGALRARPDIDEPVPYAPTAYHPFPPL